MTRVSKQQTVSVKVEQRASRTRKVRGDRKRVAVCHPRLLKYIEDINNYVEGNGDWAEEVFSEEWADKLEITAAEYGVSPVQAVILCRFLEWYDDASITEGQLANALQLSKIRFIRYQNDMEVLKNKRLIRCRTDEGLPRYSLHPGVIEALRKGKKYDTNRVEKNQRPEDFFETMKTIFELREEKWLSYQDFMGDLRFLIGCSPRLKFSKKVKKLKLEGETLMILSYFCYCDAIYETKNHTFLSPLASYAEKRSAFKQTERAFDRGEHELLRLNLLERVPDEEDSNTIDDEPMYRLTMQAREILLPDLPVLRKQKTGEHTHLGMPVLGITKEKALFYNEAEGAMIRQIESVLTGDNFRAVQERLRERGMCPGICCLFSGVSGTGKTETAMQLARKTNRDILKVNLSDLRDSYVGESEKRIKSIFDRYREILKKNALVPILLFNEADGIFSKRIRLTEHTANETVAMSENTIQNIILDEMEVFEGILIAATNLTDNLDNAFERRFLYRVDFARPGVKVREAIWRSHLPELSPESAFFLAGKYELSGGQISNIARKWAINYAITGKTADLPALESLCREDRSLAPAGKPIGFSR